MWIYKKIRKEIKMDVLFVVALVFVLVTNIVSFLLGRAYERKHRDT